jgi:hypothetical protein
MLEFFNFYSYTHTDLVAKFLAGEMFTKVQSQQIFHIVYFLFNISLYLKLALAVAATGKLEKGLSFRQQVWLGYYDLIALDFVQAYCFFEYFQTIHLGTLITPTDHYLTAVPVMTLLIVAAYQLMTTYQARHQESMPIKICRWGLATVAGLVALICGLKILYILTGQDWLALFSR